jgi:NAD(P)-dependent dehydrogenase (short-subunit alcohol dehydrogenase family)
MNISTAEEQHVMDLYGQRVVILGGTSGIGLATAKAAARSGAEVAVREQENVRSHFSRAAVGR